MKKLFYLLFMMPLFILASCNNDDDLASADITITLNGVTQENGNFYTISGNEISIENLEAKGLGNKNASLSNVVFYFQGFPLPIQPANPNNGVIDTEGLDAGTYYISFTGNLLEEGKSITMIAAQFPIFIVSSEENLPDGAPEIGSYSSTVTAKPN